MKLFDAHCHLQDPRFGGDQDGVLERAGKAGVTHAVCCGTAEGDWPGVVALGRRHPSVVPMLGVHPWRAGEVREGWLDRLRALALEHRVGIGECGLDFARQGADPQRQTAVLRGHLRLARDLDRPLAFHCVKAWGPFLDLLREEGLPRAGGLVHAYSGSAETALELQHLGLHLSFSAAIARPGNAKAAKALRAVRPERLLLESDAPDQGPLPGLNEPALLSVTLEAAARLLGEPPEALAARTHANAISLFGGLKV